MEVLMKPSTPKKRKTKTTILNTKKLKIETIGPITLNVPTKPISAKKSKIEDVVDLGIKYPILKNELLVQRFLKVPMTNNQKGRIRQAIKESLQGTSNSVVPDIVHGKIQAILKSSANLTDSQLRRIRILYNLLTSSLKGQKIVDETPSVKSPSVKPLPVLSPSPTKLTPVLETIIEKPKRKVERKINKSPEKEKTGSLEKDKTGDKEVKDKPQKKVRGPKRYVVFLGNLPLDVDKDKILGHFSEMNEHVKNIRIPKPKEGNRSAIAFMELSNEASFEFALSKHHSMLGRKRINVLYTAQKHGKVSPAEAKSKAAKLIALQKSGKLVGSTPLAKKRSQRRLKQKLAQAKAATE